MNTLPPNKQIHNGSGTSQYDKLSGFNDSDKQ